MKVDGEDVKSIQSIQLELLVKLDSICKKYKINYFLFGGTLLGAIRHQGFIPWDDDIDVCMLRNDYERFIGICTQNELGCKYFLQNNLTDKSSIIQFSKLRRNNTVMEMSNEVSASSHKGIWIDIFPLDNVSEDPKKQKKQYRDFNFFYTILTSRVKSRASTASSFSKRIARFSMFFLNKFISKKTLDKKLHKIMCRYDDYQSIYVNHLSNGTGGNRMKRFLMKKSYFDSAVPALFEGKLFPCPSNYKEILTTCYGDYMSLPPENERTSHHSIVRLEINF